LIWTGGFLALLSVAALFLSKTPRATSTIAIGVLALVLGVICVVAGVVGLFGRGKDSD
jgi:hypothetical protein